MIEIGTLLQDRYLIEKQIGAGGMGAVYLAVDQRFGNYVAIKETFYTDDEFGEAFEREARLLNGLHHPVLPHVSDYFTEHKGYFLVMQYIEGEDLSAILKNEGAFPVKDVVRWTDSLLDALDFLHSQEPPVIHRDIKPQNLKLTLRGDIILLDFGLAKFKTEETSGVKSVFGYSRKYSPLEQIQGTGTDARSDLFSLGATAYHLLTGKPPVDVLARASEIVIGNPDPLKLASEIKNEVPVSIANVLNSALALNPAARFVSAKAMRQALEFATTTDFSEIAEKLPEKVLPIVVAEDEIVNSTETENFPALESFVAETVSNTPVAKELNKENAIEIPIATAEHTLPEKEVLPQSIGVVETPTRVARRDNHSRFPVAALVALLICIGLAAGYYINKANSAGKTNKSPAIEATPDANLNPELSTTILESPEPETSDSPKKENIEEARTKPVSIEKTVEKENATEERETVAEQVVQKENVKPAPAETAPRKVPAQTPRSSQPRVIETEPVPDIESIFTGQPSKNREKKTQRRENRPRRDAMTDEEWKEMRRQRREERRRRQNINNFPF